MALVKKLPKNELGRDFVCGDIHGCYQFVEKFLTEIQFDKTKDRLISAGDLIDRGPENELCLGYLYEPWFHMVNGNHEIIMASYFASEPFGIWLWPRNGGAWGMHYRDEKSDLAMQIRDLVNEKIFHLPFIITVEKKSGGLFHVIHAEFFPKSKLTDEIIESAGQEFIDAAFSCSEDGETIFWGRYIFNSAYKQQQNDALVSKLQRLAKYYNLSDIFNDKLSHIYSGHTPVQRPIQFYGQTNLDTMAYGRFIEDEKRSWQGLSFAEPETGKLWFVNDVEFRETTPLIIQGE